MSAPPSASANSSLVSVIIPAFNYGHYIEECIGSVMEQTHRDVEVIVVDDASTDDTPAVVTAINTPTLRYVRHEANRGVAAALNTGLDIARGRYVAMIGADDAMLPENLTRKVAILDAHPDVAVAHSASIPVDEHGRSLLASSRPRTRTGEVQFQRLFPSILYGNVVGASSAVIRKEALDAVGHFDPRLSYAEDWDLFIRLAERFLFAYVDERLIRHRVHAHSMQWQSFLSGQDLDAAKEILCKAFHNFRLGEKGFSFHDLYWDRYYRALSNKVEVVPFLTSARLYLYGLSSQPRAALRAPGLKAAVKLGARALLPRRVMMSLRVRRHSRRVAGDAVGGGVPRGVGDQL